MVTKLWPIRKYITTAAASLAALVLIGRLQSADTPQVQFSRKPTSSEQQKSHKGKADLNQGFEQVKQKNPTRNPVMTDKLRKAKEGAVWGMFIADAVAMPVHWYYDPSDIKQDYGGWLTGYVAPNKRHPSSILTLSATGGSGRSGWNTKSKNVIGSVILHDKLQYWASNDRSTHYHQGMEAGDNTLNAITALHFLQTMQRVDPNCVKSEEEVRGAVMEDYVKFMTTPGSHNDTYAESFHRSFFKDWSALKEPPTTAKGILDFTAERFQDKAKGFPDSQLVVIGALAPAIPWILRNAHKSEAECAKEAMEAVKMTHPVPTLLPFIEIYARLLHSVLNGGDLKQEVLKYSSHSEMGGAQKRQAILHLVDKADRYAKGSEGRLEQQQYATGRLGSACYIEGAMSSLFFLALQYADDFEAGVLGNANCGGENCHRGMALGALLGAAAVNKGLEIPRKLKDGLGSAKPDLIKLLEQENSL